jgi:hypothetical protein
MNTSLFIKELSSNADRLKHFIDNKTIDTVGKKIKVLFVEKSLKSLKVFKKKFHGSFDLHTTDCFDEAEMKLELNDFEYCVIDANDKESIAFADKYNSGHCKFVIFADDKETLRRAGEYKANVIDKRELMEADKPYSISQLLFCA